MTLDPLERIAAALETIARSFDRQPAPEPEPEPEPVEDPAVDVDVAALHALMLKLGDLAAIEKMMADRGINLVSDLDAKGRADLAADIEALL